MGADGLGLGMSEIVGRCDMVGAGVGCGVGIFVGTGEIVGCGVGQEVGGSGAGVGLAVG